MPTNAASRSIPMIFRRSAVSTCNSVFPSNLRRRGTHALTGGFPSGDPGPFLNSTAGAIPVSFRQILHPGGCLKGQIQRTNFNGTDGTVCEQNISGDYAEIQPYQVRYGVYAHAKERFSNAATFYMDASYFEEQCRCRYHCPYLQLQHAS